MMSDKEKLVELIAEMEEEDALVLAQEMLDGGVDPLVVLDLCREAMDIVGKRFEEGEYFLPELILAGEVLDQIGAMTKPLIQQSPDSPSRKLGRVLIGTVHGDLHDIGKNIVTFMLDINGFEVKDIGIDVPVARFIEEIKAFQPNVVCLSGFLTLAFDSMKETIEAIEAAGMRDKLKIQIGGGQIDETIRAYTGADAFGLNAVDAVTYSRKCMGE
ncbi:B12-binding domain-containing protein [Desulfuromonas sp. TF]|uniref:cobalamin B12-binding domain-containing protein n=1 Tax=Desulfuromonas sp. TF TaxID=1232410 RepID=UPI00041E4973|nr:cobalamin-dependent protein [Desulfuromonas sp. TF]